MRADRHHYRVAIRGLSLHDERLGDDLYVRKPLAFKALFEPLCYSNILWLPIIGWVLSSLRSLRTSTRR